MKSGFPQYSPSRNFYPLYLRFIGHSVTLCAHRIADDSSAQNAGFKTSHFLPCKQRVFEGNRACRSFNILRWHSRCDMKNAPGDVEQREVGGLWRPTRANPGRTFFTDFAKTCSNEDAFGVQIFRPNDAIPTKEIRTPHQLSPSGFSGTPNRHPGGAINNLRHYNPFLT